MKNKNISVPDRLYSHYRRQACLMQTDRYCPRLLGGHGHVTLRAAIPIRYAVRNTLAGKCVRAVPLGLFAKTREKLLEASGKPEL